MQYVGHSIAEIIEREEVFDVINVMLQIIECYKQLEKFNLFYFDLHISNICILEKRVYFVDVSSIKVLNLNDNLKIVKNFFINLLGLIGINNNELKDILILINNSNN